MITTMITKTEQLTKTLTRFYSELSFTSESAMTKKLECIDWTKEQKKLKILMICNLILVSILSMFLILFVVILIKNWNNPVPTKISLAGVTGYIGGLVVCLVGLFRTMEKYRFFKLMKELLGK